MQDARSVEEKAFRVLGAALFCARVARKAHVSQAESEEVQRCTHLCIPSVEQLAKRLRATIGMCDLQFRRDANMERQAQKALDVIRVAKQNEQLAGAAVLEHCADAANVEETCAALRSLQDSEDTRWIHELVRRAAVNRFLGCRRFRLAAQDLHRQVKAHRQAHRGTQLSIGFLGDDLLGEIATHLPYRSVPALVASCREFSKFVPLLEAMPRLSARPIVGVVDGYAVKGQILALYTDLVVEGAEGRECYELKCKRFGMAPNRRALVQGLRNRRELGVRRHKDADPQPGRYRHRVGHDLFFSTPLVCKAALVFADTLEPVGEPLQDCPWVELSGANCTYTCPNMNPHPARGSFRVPVLSSKHGHRQFRIAVSGTARLHGPGPERTKTLHAFSEPFFALSRRKRPR